jgi:hypothetical protein
MPKIVFVPEGGLANRMRAICSARSLAMESGEKLRVVWFCDEGLNAPFCALFEPLREVRDASWFDKLTLDRPRRRNLHLPAFFQFLLFRKRMYAAEVDARGAEHFNFLNWVGDTNIYMTSYATFWPLDDADYVRIFRPVADIKEEVERRVAQFAPYTVGMHIRRSDHELATQVSTTDLFVEAADKELLLHADLKIYLATDSEEVKAAFRERYGARVLTAASAADRSSVEGVKDAVTELFTLGRTAKIYGSFRSSYSNMASKLYGTPLVIVKTPSTEGSGVTF